LEGIGVYFRWKDRPEGRKSSWAQGEPKRCAFWFSEFGAKLPPGGAQEFHAVKLRKTKTAPRFWFAQGIGGALSTAGGLSACGGLGVPGAQAQGMERSGTPDSPVFYTFFAVSPQKTCKKCAKKPKKVNTDRLGTLYKKLTIRRKANKILLISGVFISSP
jgi:hypothetical protein